MPMLAVHRKDSWPPRFPFMVFRIAPTSDFWHTIWPEISRPEVNSDELYHVAFFVSRAYFSDSPLVALAHRVSRVFGSDACVPGQGFCGFEHIQTAEIYLAVFEKIYRTTPLSLDAQPRIRGKSPLELAGYDLSQMPRGQPVFLQPTPGVIISQEEGQYVPNS